MRESWWLGCVGIAIHFAGCGGRTGLGFDDRLNEGGALSTSGGTSSVSGAFARGGRSMAFGGTLGSGGAAHGGRTARGGTTSSGGQPSVIAGAAGAEEVGGVAGGFFDAGNGPGGAGGETGLTHDWFVDPNAGDDANPGTRALPFKTLATAAQHARSADTIWLLSGPVNEMTEPRFAAVATEPDDSACGDVTGVALPRGVALRSDAELTTTLSISGHHGLCAADNALSGLRFVRAAPYGYALEFSGGNGDLRNVAFSNYSGPDGELRQSMLVSGDSFVLWTTMPTTQLIADGPAAHINGKGRLEIVGGAAQLFPTRTEPLHLFGVSEAGTLRFHDVSLSGSTTASYADAVVTTGQQAGAYPTVEFWDHTSVQGFNFGCRMSRSAHVVVSQSSFVGQATYGLFLLPSPIGDDSRIDIASSTFQGSRVAIYAVAQSLTATVQNSQFLNNVTGIVFAGAQSLTLKDVTVQGNEQLGVLAGAESLHVRNTVVQQNGGTGIQLSGQLLSADLGSSLDPGNNIFADNAVPDPTATNLSLNCANGCRVLASGNQWDPNVQGSDGAGRYSAGSGSLEATSGAGQNYAITAGTLVLAE